MTTAMPAAPSADDYWAGTGPLPSGVGPALLARVGALVDPAAARDSFPVTAPFTGGRLGTLPR
ncbi:MAG: hypothetical protein JWN79_304, partial [Gemmatimonadetes bacterium]|nr:hypothetical protein [Gemmatimonadota bacterium]